MEMSVLVRCCLALTLFLPIQYTSVFHFPSSSLCFYDVLFHLLSFPLLLSCSALYQISRLHFLLSLLTSLPHLVPSLQCPLYTFSFSPFCYSIPLTPLPTPPPSFFFLFFPPPFLPSSVISYCYFCSLFPNSPFSSFQSPKISMSPFTYPSHATYYILLLFFFSLLFLLLYFPLSSLHNQWRRDNEFDSPVILIGCVIHLRPDHVLCLP